MTAPACAAQEWELNSVTRGGSWEVSEAKGLLKQNQKMPEGVLKDKADGKADYRILTVLTGAQAKATFQFISENDERTILTGSTKKQLCAQAGQLIQAATS